MGEMLKYLVDFCNCGKMRSFPACPTILSEKFGFITKICDIHSTILREVSCMPNIKSAKKRVKVNKVKADQNKAAKTNLKTILKKADAAVSTGAADKETAITVAIKSVDQAVAKGLLHKNAAARKKSQLALKLNAAKA